MTVRILLALGILGALAAWAWYFERQRPDPPSQPRAHIPAQLDRDDFLRPEAPWLVVLFSSAECDRCHEIAPKVAVLDSDSVATQEVEYFQDQTLHSRYGIDGVPIVVIADHEGVVRQHFSGALSATDLWAAVARLRDPERVPPGCGDHD